MFLVDDALGEVLGYIKDRIGEGRKDHDDAVKHARVAMRELSKSLSEIQAILEAGIHRLRRASRDSEQFRATLRELVDHDVLMRACNESGVCKDLRVAEDELRALSTLYSSFKQQRILNLAHQISTHEHDFVLAVREFLSSSRDCDLTTVASNPNADPPTVIAALEERVQSMAEINSKIEEVLALFR